MEGEEIQRKEVLKVDVAGKDKILWASLKDKFFLQAQKLLDTVINFEDNTTVADEAKQFSTELIKFAKEKLKKAGYENEKTLAEIEEILSKAQRTQAETRKITAEAREIELGNKLKELKLSLGIMKAIHAGETDEESIIFIKKIDTFFEVINTYELQSPKAF